MQYAHLKYFNHGESLYHFFVSSILAIFFLQLFISFHIIGQVCQEDLFQQYKKRGNINA